MHHHHHIPLALAKSFWLGVTSIPLIMAEMVPLSWADVEVRIVFAFCGVLGGVGTVLIEQPEKWHDRIGRIFIGAVTAFCGGEVLANKLNIAEHASGLFAACVFSGAVGWWLWSMVLRGVRGISNSNWFDNWLKNRMPPGGGGGNSP